MNLDSPAQADLAKFGTELFSRLSESPFGALSKGELEIAIYGAMLHAGIVRISESTFDVALKLQCTPSKASALAFNHSLRSAATNKKERQAELASAIDVADIDVSKDIVVLNVESRYWRETFINELKRLRVFTDTSFNRERVSLSTSTFLEACPELFGAAGAKIQREVNGSRTEKNRAKKLKTLWDGALSGTGKAAAGEIFENVVRYSPTAIAAIAALIT